MRGERTSSKNHVGTARRNLRQSYWRTSSTAKSPSGWLLLAHHEEGLHGTCQALRSLSKTKRRPPSSPGNTAFNSCSLAFPYMGDRHPWTFSSSKTPIKVPHCSSRISNEMDRGRPGGHNRCIEGGKIFMKEHCMPIRCTSSSHIRQRNSILQLSSTTHMPEIGDNPTFFFRRASTD